MSFLIFGKLNLFKPADFKLSTDFETVRESEVDYTQELRIKLLQLNCPCEQLNNGNHVMTSQRITLDLLITSWCLCSAVLGLYQFECTS